MPSPRSPAALIAVFCLAQSLAQLGAFALPALLPELIGEWRLSHTEAGWLSGIFFGAYSLAVPVLVTLTDRVPARRVYVLAVGLTALSHLGFAFLAGGFWSGVAFRVLAGVGWAGTYMVGLKALSDHLDGPAQTRGVAAHAASIGVSGALSFVIAGTVASRFGWPAAFVAGAAGALGALLVAAAAFPPEPARAGDAPRGRLLDFGPVFRNRAAMAYATGYCVHTWEMFVVRSWAVTFLTWVAVREGGVPLLLAPAAVAMLMELVGTTTSVLGNEVALRIGRRRWIVAVMAASMAAACGVGFSAALGYGAAALALLFYNALIYADSASLTAGTVGAAEPGRRGATLAVHAMLGYGGGFVGPLVMGVAIDALGGESLAAWGLGFAHLAVAMIVGPVALLSLGRRAGPGR